MGQLQRPGPATSGVALLATKTPAAPETSIFAGIDTMIHVPGYAVLIDSARAALTPWRPSATLSYLIRALRLVGMADTVPRTLLERAIAIAAGVSIDGTADDGIVTPGERLQIEVTVWNAGDSTVRVDSIGVAAPAGWSLERLELGAPTVAPGSLLTRRFVLTVAKDAERTQPYFLRRPRSNRGGLYDWSAAPADVRGLPFEPPPVSARVRLVIGGEPVTLTREVVYRYRDQAIGEVRRPIFVTRDVDVAIAPDELLWPIDGGSREPRHFTVTVTNRARGPATVRAAVTSPAGWPPIPAESLAFTREDETKSVAVAVAPPTADSLKAGTYDLRAGSGWLEIIDYPHIRPRALPRPSVAQIRAARVTLPGLSHVGYVRGAADRVPEALLAIGVPVELIGADSLARGDLSRYDAIVIGSRAYETEPALVANNGRLLDYVTKGGLLIVQYQQYPFVDGGFAPYPLTIARPHDRVTDENAPVTERLARLDSGAWAVLRAHVGHDLRAAPRDARPPTSQPIAGVEGGPVDRAAWTRDVRLYRIEFLPAASGWGAGSVSLVHESAGPEATQCPVTQSRCCSWSPRVRATRVHPSSFTRPTAGICSPCSSTASRPCIPTSTCAGSTWARRTSTTASAPSAPIRRRTYGSAVRR
ncbi:MAG: hypothetical protein AUH75_09085 [Gemmatimonadetes bacterium 13_1_40CM_4_65_7]|nr:MAG: hypothetical protein AUH75_09085 [Gemmatimonadetes bacterium 13_1_40CM_4_65_7]